MAYFKLKIKIEKLKTKNCARHPLRASQRLPLLLLVFGVFFANNVNPARPLHDLAVLANFLDRGSHFHIFLTDNFHSAGKNRGIRQLAALPR